MTFGSQANALLRKSASYQQRNIGTNICLLSAPLLFCILLLIIQLLINNVLLSGDAYSCGCKCLACCYTGDKDTTGLPFYYLSDPTTMVNMTAATNGDGRPKCIDPIQTPSGPCPESRSYSCSKTDSSVCGIQYSTGQQGAFCPIDSPSSWPPILQVPEYDRRYKPNKPAATTLVTSSTPELTQTLGNQLFNQLDLVGSRAVNLAEQLSGPGGSFNGYVLSELGFQFGTSEDVFPNYYVETAFLQFNTTYAMLPNGTCASRGMNQTEPVSLVKFASNYLGFGAVSPLSTFAARRNTSNTSAGLGDVEQVMVVCTDAAVMALPSAAEVNSLLRCGYYQARCTGVSTVNEFAGAWDFGDSSRSKFNVTVQYNSTGTSNQNNPKPNLRIATMVSQGAKAWWRTFTGNTDVAPPISLLGLMSMPKAASKLELDFASLLGPIFFTWVVSLLFPTFLQQLVYEKEKRLRMMMKMHGLGDRAYWTITYLWYLALYVLYIIIFIAFGAAINLKMFRKTNLGIQVIFYFLHGNCMIAFAFVLSSLFSSSKTATIFAFLYVFATGLIGQLLLNVFIDKNSSWLFYVEWIPAFSLYRGLQEMASYTFLGVYRNQPGMQFSNLSDAKNGMATTWAIFAVEWVIFMVLGWYLEQVVSTGNGIKRHPLFFLQWMWRKDATAAAPHLRTSSDGTASSDGTQITIKAQGELADVQSERHRVETMTEYDESPIVIRDMKKIYPGLDGGKPKMAVSNLTMAIGRGECFGLLGPNGAGKTTAIGMLVGFLEPTDGSAIVDGMDIRQDMQSIYKIMGVCPQHDLLWDQLTGREHLRFYGRLKGFKGPELEEAVDSALKSLNLFNGGVADKLSCKYSGGMKRRLSVAISFMGSPKVVYLDEPSTGLDPNSRRSLWDVVRAKKEGRATILTTHSMEEAEALCDRLGIFVDGQLVCIGNPREITSRYGGYLVFQIMVPPAQEAAAKEMVTAMCPSAVLTYSLGGTLKYELPTSEVTLSTVFAAMNSAKTRMEVLDWGVSNASLEEVFIKFARSINATGSDA